MNLNNLYMSLLVVLFSTNITADGNHSEFNCYSTDPEVGDSALWAGEAIELFSQNKFEESIEVVDAVLFLTIKLELSLDISLLCLLIHHVQLKDNKNWISIT